MSLGIAFKNVNYNEIKIPTRFDDIQKEIIAERMKNCVEAYKKYIPQINEPNITYKLGDVIGKKLSKII